MAGLDLAPLGIPTDIEYMEQYCKGMNLPPVDDWNVYIAFSFFRIAAIVQGVYKRALQGMVLLFFACVFLSSFPAF